MFGEFERHRLHDTWRESDFVFSDRRRNSEAAQNKQRMNNEDKTPADNDPFESNFFL